jgi:hypothetical protein
MVVLTQTVLEGNAKEDWDALKTQELVPSLENMIKKCLQYLFPSYLLNLIPPFCLILFCN